MRVLFVCLGNICRSPTAESVFRHLAEKNAKPWIFDSAGTSDNHVGEASDPRSIRHAHRRGYEMTHSARQFAQQDFDIFDLILVMDKNNYQDVIRLANEQAAKKVKLVTDYCQQENPGHVPDPYYGGDRDFEAVLDLLEDAALGFFQKHK